MGGRGGREGGGVMRGENSRGPSALSSLAVNGGQRLET